MTIPLDPRFIPAFSIEDVILDKDTGAPLSGGLVYFEEDNQRGILKRVYQITGASPNYTFIQLPNPMTLSSIGTFEDALENPVIPYFYPYDANGKVDLYYIRVTSSEDVPQFTREAQPYLGTGNTPGEVANIVTNEISNPQFAEVLFDTSSSTYTFNVNAVTDDVLNLAPDWDLVVSAAGAGTVTVSQLKPAGALNVLTNPGTLLTITSAGLSKLWLRQRLYGSPNLWGSGYLSASFVGATYSGTTTTVNMYYSQSDGTVVNQLLINGSFPASGAYAGSASSVQIPASTSADNFPDAYIEIYFDLPLSIQIDITSVMVAFTGTTIISNIAYEQESLSRQIDHLFHYYQPQINFKAIPSLLTGWDFPLNPAQARGATVTMNTTSAYIWDQTIGQSVVGNIAVIRNAVTGGFQATTASAAEAFYVMQYLTGVQAKKFLGTRLAVNINAFRTQAGGVVTAKVYLYRGSAAAVVPTLPATIGGNTPLNASGVFTVNTTGGQGLNWTLIPRSDFGQASSTLPTVTTADYSTLNDASDLQFSGWEIIDSTQISDTDKFCIVVTFQCPTSGSVIVVNSISAVPGDIPTRPAPMTLNDTILECQYYYQKSFFTTTVPVQNAGANTGESHAPQTTAAATSGLGPVIRYPEQMRAAPTIILYNPAATNAQIRNFGTGTDFTLSTVSGAGNVNGFVTTGTSPGGSALGNDIGIHWTADARLGIV